MISAQARWRVGILVALALVGLGLGLWASQRPGPTPDDRMSRPETQAPGQEPGGPGLERGQVNESVEYIIRDRRGRIKERKTVGGE